jgi:hypothetical protein
MSRLVTRGLIAAALLAGIGATSTAAPAAAASPLQQVSITSHMTFNFPDANTGDFIASGPAADSGLICGAGDVLDIGVIFVGFQSNLGYQVLVRKAFTCDDGSGTIFVKIQVHGNSDGTETFNWVVLGGTGAYASLQGSGSGTTVPNADPDSGNTNFYGGFLVG